jgi:hypothetical protein
MRNIDLREIILGAMGLAIVLASSVGLGLAVVVHPERPTQPGIVPAQSE